MTEKFVIEQAPRTAPGHPEQPAYIKRSTFSPMFGWRNFDFKIDGEIVVFPTLAEAENWITENSID